MRREEEEGNELAVAFPITLEAGIAAAVGDFDIIFNDKWIQYLGGRVTEVPAGKSYEIHILYDIRNRAAGLTFWSISTTCKNITDNVSIGYKNRGDCQFSGWKTTIEDAVNATMPSHAITVRIKIFANQVAMAGTPPTNLW